VRPRWLPNEPSQNDLWHLANDRAGVTVGRCRYLITRLGLRLSGNWYDAADASLGRGELLFQKLRGSRSSVRRLGKVDWHCMHGSRCFNADGRRHAAIQGNLGTPPGRQFFLYCR